MVQQSVQESAQPVTCKFEGQTFKVYIYGLLHLSLYVPDYAGLVSWMEAPEWWCVYIHMKGLENPIFLEYDSEERWKTIIKILDENL